jgi:hypothetical protein
MACTHAPRDEGPLLRSPAPGVPWSRSVNGPAKILALQRLAGNRAVTQILHREGSREDGVPVQRSGEDDRIVDDDLASDYRIWSSWGAGTAGPSAATAGASGTGAGTAAAPPPRPWGAMADAASAGRADYMSVGEAQRLFEGVKDREFLSTKGWMEEIPYDQAELYCADRASHIALQLTSVGVACKRIFVVKSLADGAPGLWVNSTTAPGARPGRPVKLRWEYHVAVAVDVQDAAGRPAEMIFDPAVDPAGPILLNQWLQAVHADTEAPRMNRIGESHDEATERLQQLHTEDPSRPVNGLGFPLGSTWVLATEPGAVNIPKIDRSGNPQSYPLSMDGMSADFRNWREELEGQVENSHKAREEREQWERERASQWYRRLLARGTSSGTDGPAGLSSSVAPGGATPGGPPSLRWPPNSALALRRLPNDVLVPNRRPRGPGPAAGSERNVYEMEWRGEQQPAPGRTSRRGTWLRRWRRGLP